MNSSMTDHGSFRIKAIVFLVLLMVLFLSINLWIKRIVQEVSPTTEQAPRTSVSDDSEKTIVAVPTTSDHLEETSGFKEERSLKSSGESRAVDPNPIYEPPLNSVILMQ